MGSQISVPCFNFMNNIISLSGAGLFAPILIFKSCNLNLINLFLITSLAVGTVVWFCSEDKKVTVSKSKVIFITGCDSGIGYTFAQHAWEMGYTVIATFLNKGSAGARQLMKTCTENFHAVELNLIDTDSIIQTVEFINTYFKNNKNKVLHALINNAGVMVFSEFEWITDDLIDLQVNVNLLGTIKITRYLMPLVRRHKGRIIVLGSHCGQATLPGLATYGATKAALHGWCDAIRVELKKFNIPVIKFIPGSFVTKSCIMTRLNSDREKIEKNLSEEQRSFYQGYFSSYYAYLSSVPLPSTVEKIQDQPLLQNFESAVNLKYPKPLYKSEPLQYKIHHLLFKISPTPVRDYFMTKFINTPKWPPIHNS